jgi:hypothetical protein
MPFSNQKRGFGNLLCAYKNKIKHQYLLLMRRKRKQRRGEKGNAREVRNKVEDQRSALD